MCYLLNHLMNFALSINYDTDTKLKAQRLSYRGFESW